MSILITKSQRRCPCGKPAHPAYGGVCEDCWAAAQPETERCGVLQTPGGEARSVITAACGGLYCWIVDDGATDHPVAVKPVPPPARAFRSEKLV